MDKVIILVIAAILLFGISIIIGYKMPIKKKKELSEQEKTMRALRVLIYIILGLIIAGVAFKLLLLYGILNFSAK